MNWHHWYWWTWPAGIAIGVTLICVKNWIVNEIGCRRTMAEFRERGYFRSHDEGPENR